jgi:hypothetical protein
VEEIEEVSVGGCSSITSLEPLRHSSVTRIGEFAFKGCDGITSLDGIFPPSPTRAIARFTAAKISFQLEKASILDALCTLVHSTAVVIWRMRPQRRDTPPLRPGERFWVRRSAETIADQQRTIAEMQQTIAEQQRAIASLTPVLPAASSHGVLSSQARQRK